MWPWGLGQDRWKEITGKQTKMQEGEKLSELPNRGGRPYLTFVEQASLCQPGTRQGTSWAGFPPSSDYILRGCCCCYYYY